MPVSVPVRRVGVWGLSAGMLTCGLLALQSEDSLHTSLRSGGMLLAPVVLALAALRAGRWAGALALGISAIAVAVSSSALVGPYVIGMGLLVAFLVMIGKRRLRWNGVVLGGLALAIALAAVDLFGSAAANQRSLLAECQVQFATAKTSIDEAIAASPAASSEAQKEQLELIRDQFLRFVPAMVLATYGFSIAVAIVGTVLVSRSRTVDSPDRVEFAAWRLPDTMVFVFLGVSVTLLGAWTQEWSRLVLVMENALLVLGGLYLAQGVAIIHAFARHVALHPALEGLLLGMMVLAWPLLISVAMLGLFDFHLDFRGRWLPAAPSEGEPHSHA